MNFFPTPQPNIFDISFQKMGTTIPYVRSHLESLDNKNMCFELKQ